jgi:phosphate transport system substrate-binding protein
VKGTLAATIVFLGFAYAPAHAQEPGSLPRYEPQQRVTGVIRSWGHGYLRAMMGYWEEGFRKFHPDVRFEDTLVSSAAAMAGLYSDRADIGVLAREITAPEIAAYEKMTRQKVFAVTVLTGSYGNPDKIMALGVFVNKDNPISKLSFKQLDAIFGAEHRRGAQENVRRWGQLGADGKWSEQSIHPYSGLAFEAPGAFFSNTVMNGSVLWNCGLHQFQDIAVPGGKDIDGYQEVVNAVGSDPHGIGIAGAGYVRKSASVKLLALARDDDGPYVEATQENVANLTYPLARRVNFYIHHGATRPADPTVIEFLRYVVSREGQEQVLREGDFMPLTAEVARKELRKLQ